MAISSSWSVNTKERLFGSVLTETLLEFGALEDRVEHVVKSPLVVGHHVSTFFH